MANSYFYWHEGMDHFLVFHHDVLCCLEFEHPKLNSWIRPCSMPPLWGEALRTATFLTNICLTNAKSFMSPGELLFGHPPPYHTLRVFGCLCYPNILYTMPNKLSPGM
jgi:hypothetical protein